MGRRVCDVPNIAAKQGVVLRWSIGHENLWWAFKLMLVVASQASCCQPEKKRGGLTAPE
jgi:hypothetical protein